MVCGIRSCAYLAGPLAYSLPLGERGSSWFVYATPHPPNPCPAGPVSVKGWLGLAHGNVSAPGNFHIPVLHPLPSSSGIPPRQALPMYGKTKNVW